MLSFQEQDSLAGKMRLNESHGTVRVRIRTTRTPAAPDETQVLLTPDCPRASAGTGREDGARARPPRTTAPHAHCEV